MGLTGAWKVAKAMVFAGLIAGGLAPVARADIARFDLSTAGQVAQFPKVAVDSAGNAQYVWLRTDGANAIVQARVRNADGTLGPVEDISDAGGNADTPQVATDGQGRTHFTWGRYDGSNFIVQARTRAADGTLGATQDLSAAGQDAADPRVAANSLGDAYYVWRRYDGSNFVVQAREQVGNGTFSALSDLSAPGQSAQAPQVAADAQGNAYYTWVRSDGSKNIVQARARASSGIFSATQDLSASGQDAYAPQVAAGTQGTSHYTWRRYDGSNLIVQARARAADGTLSATQDLSAPGRDGSDPQLAVDTQGAAHYTWYRNDGSTQFAQARVRAADGTLSPTQNLSAPGGDAFVPQAAADPQGNTHYTWDRFEGSNFIVQTRVQGADGTLGSTQDLAAPGENSTAENTHIAFDAFGDAHYTWRRGNGPGYIVQGAVASVRANADAPSVTQNDQAVSLDVLGNDENGPRVPLTIASVTQPSNGTVAIAADGKSVTYAPRAGYCNSQAGGARDTFTYTLNNGSAASVSVAVACAPVPPEPFFSAPAAPSAPRDTTAPTLTGARFSATRFTVDTGATASAAAATKRGTRLTFRLSEPATVVFVTEQRRGRRWRKVRIFGQRFSAGKHTINYSGKIKPRGKQRALKPGRYRLRMRPSDRAGNKGKVTTLRFTIVKR